MFIRTCDLVIAVAVVAAVSGACGQSAPAVDICGRGSRPELRAVLGGGSLEVRFLDADGNQLGMRQSVTADGGHVAAEPPPGAVTVEVTGFAGSTPVAHGIAPVDGNSGACVCLALTGEEHTVCENLTCIAASGGCRFYDPDGAAVTDQTASFGEGTTHHGVTVDTYLRSDLPNDPHSTEDNLRVKVSPLTVGLLRFDLTSLPPASMVSRAELHLDVCIDPVCETDVSLALYAVREDWSSQATWNQRMPGVAWSGPGASAASRDAVATAHVGGLVHGDHVVDITARVADWVATPATNFGIVLVLESTAPHDLRLLSSEAVDSTTRPHVVVTYQVP